ncbi:MAG: hypothetical protein J2P15_06625 [Micromonosporaceae bacterium]|nr:hypothetical protein [Micromonosporaceae bacterium]
MTALIRLRLTGLTRTGRAIAPILGGLAIIGIIYGGGPARPTEAYGLAAIVLFPVLAWLTKILLDVEPDTQRQLSVVLLGSWRREILAGLLAAGIASLPVVGLSLLLPWIIGGVTLSNGGPSLLPALLLGLWAHLIAVPPAVALGALSSRVIAVSAGRAAAVLAGGVVLVLVLGIPGSPVPWLAPPLLSVAHTLADIQVRAAPMLPFTGWALVWTGVVLVGYGWLRRTRT